MSETSFYSEAELESIGFQKCGNNVLISRKASLYGVDRMCIGNNVRVDDFCILSGKVELGDYVHVAAYTALYGGESGVYMKKFSGISSRCCIYAENDDYSGKHMANPTIPQKYRNVICGAVVLEEHVIVGTGCTILPGVTIKKGAAVGAMSLIKNSLGAWGIYAGIPVKKIGVRSKDLLELENLWGGGNL